MKKEGGAAMAKSIVGERILAGRKRQGLTQVEVAELAELDRNHMGAIERGTTEAGFYTLMRVAGAIGLTIEEVAGGMDFVPGENPAGHLELRRA
jgi:transcriptional regulator with XRE-family HTH domain